MPHNYRLSGSSAKGAEINAGESRHGSKALYIATVILDTVMMVVCLAVIKRLIPLP